MAIDLKNNKHVEILKKGFQDIQTVLQEGNVKLFLKQGIAVLIIFLLFRYVSGKNVTKVNDLQTQLGAISAQENNEQEYLRNKDTLLDLEPRFPDISMKNEWLVGKVLEVFKTGQLAPQVTGQQSEDSSNPTYVAVGLDVNTNAEFDKFAEFLADIENHDEFLKVSNFSLKKDVTPSGLGNNQITMRFNTIFPKEKIASRMFKDYNEQMEKRKAKTPRRQSNVQKTPFRFNS